MMLAGASVSKPRVHTVQTRHGAAKLHVSGPDLPTGVVLLGHGAGGSATTPLLLAVAEALVAAGLAVVLLDQPYRVAGRRSPAPAPQLDAAVVDVVARLRAEWPDLPLIVGGKSSGGRVGCRVASTVGAVGVVVLGFPLRPPARPDRSRAAELAAGCPVLVVQGSRDSFGTPDEVRSAAGDLPVTVHEVAGGDHSFVPRKGVGRTRHDCFAEVAAVVTLWVGDLLGSGS